MSTGASITDQVSKLKECAVAAAHLDDQFGRLALFLEGFGAPDIARQVRALDVPTLLTLPVDEGERLLMNLRKAVLQLKNSLIASLTATDHEAPPGA